MKLLTSIKEFFVIVFVAVIIALAAFGFIVFYVVYTKGITL